MPTSRLILASKNGHPRLLMIICFSMCPFIRAIFQLLTFKMRKSLYKRSFKSPMNGFPMHQSSWVRTNGRNWTLVNIKKSDTFYCIKLIIFIGRRRRNRTLINGFGDRCSTIEPDSQIIKQQKLPNYYKLFKTLFTSAISHLPL